MNIAHFADTHLGSSGTGVQRHVQDTFTVGVQFRQQEVDIRSAFVSAVDRIIEQRPDLVLHAGDLFDHPHPTPQTLDLAFWQFRRLSQERIPVVLVEGDHSAARSPAQGAALNLLAHIPGITVACGGSACRIEVGETIIHAVPHGALFSEEPLDVLSDSFETESGRWNILLAHGVADGLPFYRTWRTAASVIVGAVAAKFDYVALGHCHRFGQVRKTDRAFYAGATAMANAGDFRPGHIFGFNRVKLMGGGRPPEVARELLPTRPMHAYGLSDARGCSATQIMDYLEQQVAEVPPTDAYCRVLVEQIDPPVRSQLSHREIERLFFPLPQVAGVSIDLRSTAAAFSKSADDSKHTPLERYLERAAADLMSEDLRSEVIALGKGFLEQAEAELRIEDQAGIG